MKKRVLSMILALVLLIGLLPIQANADELENGLMYKVYWNYIEIYGYTGNDTQLVIPSEIKGLPVTTISHNAFNNSDSLTSVYIPASVTSIGFYPFMACSNLNRIYVDKNNPNYCTDDRGVLFDKAKTVIIDVPDRIAGTYRIPDGVISISPYAFSECSDLTSIFVPDGVTTIELRAFSLCTSLTSITLPDSVTSIGNGAFYRCVSLTKIDLPDNLTTIEMTLFWDCVSLTSVLIPDSVTSIDYEAFYHCTSLTSITIPDSVTSIKGWAFMLCSNLTSIIFQGDAPQFDPYIFNDVITTAHYPSGNATWTEDILQDYGGKITWFTHDPSHAPEYTAVVTEPTCTEQGYTTYTCECGYSYPSEYVDALDHNFADGFCTRCGWINNGLQYKLRKDYVEITHYVGNGKELVIPAEIEGLPVTLIGCFSFLDRSSLTSIDLPDSLTSIGKHTFDGCSNLTSIDLPVGLTSIGWNAFADCSSLTSIDLPDSVTSIESGTFEGCTSLTSITIPNRVASIWSDAFSGCSSLTSIIFKGDAPEFGSGIFIDVTAIVNYPTNNSTWTEDVMLNYGGKITWVAHETSHAPEYHAASTTAPTCTEQGFTVYACACGSSYVSDYVKALGHNYAKGSCTRCGEADPNYNPVEPPFLDVPADSFYAAPVLWALENGITTGISPTSFAPEEQCSRSQVVTFLWRTLGSSDPYIDFNPFSDVTSSDFFYKPVLWALENGITTGLSPNYFGAAAPCNRAQVVTFLWRAAGCPEPSSTDDPFADVSPTDYYYKPVLWALENGITTGLSPNHFGAAAPCNRAQVVTFLYRAYN